MTREVIATKNAPGAVGPYSQGIKANGFVFTAGQVGLDPTTGKLVEGDVTDQARQVLKNLKAILEAAGSSLDMVVKATVFMMNMGDFKRVNEVYAEFFVGQPPARSAIQVAALPLGALIEIETVALVK